MISKEPISKGDRRRQHGLSVGIIAILFFAIAAEHCAAENNTGSEVQRPRVGLVLGGGGARGAAHIGVLRELERQRVPIDAIVGTSMGAIVGGLYATGMTAEELQELVSSLDWADALSDAPARTDLSFRRKQDDRQFPVGLEIGVRHGELALPQGVIQGQKLDLLLRRLTLHTSGAEDFDEFGIPFRAIASDLVTGEPYVIGHGDLAEAIRASMSVPGIFAPVEIDGRVLVDGGIVGNLGVNVVQSMDVDLVIAVDVEFPLYDKPELDSALAISEQVLTMLIRNGTRRQIALLDDDDILIRPELGTFPSTDFPGIVAAIKPGEDAASALTGKLQKLSVTDAEYVRHLAERRTGAEKTETLAFVRVEHDSRVSGEMLARRMDIEAGDTIDALRLEAEANRLQGLEVFEKVGYRLVEENDQTGVLFSAESKRWGPAYLQFGLNFEDDFEGSSSFNLAARFWRPALNRFGAELRAVLQLGTEPFLSAEYYQPVSAASAFFVAPRITLGQRNLRAFEAGDSIARYRVSETEMRFDIGAELGRWGEVRVGVFRGSGDAKVKVGVPTLPGFDFNTGGVFAQLEIDTFDDAFFPTAGARASAVYSLSRSGLGADSHHDTIELAGNFAWSRGKSSFVAGFEYGTALDTVTAIQDHFSLGGFLRLSGFERGQISGPHYSLARMVYFRRIGDSAGALIDVPIYMGASIEAGNVWQMRDDISTRSLFTNGNVFLGLDTYLGPAYLGVGFAESGGTNFYLNIGSTPR